MKEKIADFLKAGLLVVMIICMGSCGTSGKTVVAVISGLSGGSLVIQNNGADDITITQDGDYKFRTKIEKEGSYSVTIYTQPDTKQTCIVDEGAGTVENSDVSVNIECRGKKWFHPVDMLDFVSPVCMGNVQKPPKAAMDDKGNALIVWVQEDGHPANAYYRVYMSQYLNGVWTHPSDCADFISIGTWGSTDDENVVYGNPVGSPRVAMDNEGNAIVAWVQSDGSNNLVYLSEYRDGNWNHPSSLDEDNFSPEGQNVSKVEAAMSGKGEAAVAWIQNNGSNDMVYMREYRDGEWSEMPDLATGRISPAGQNASKPDVAMDNYGNTLITWIQSNGSTDQLYKSEYRDFNGDGAYEWRHPANLSSFINFDNGYGVNNPRAVMSDNGDAMIAWIQGDYNGYDQVFFSHYRDGKWNHPLNDITRITPFNNNNNCSSLQLSMNNSGDALITWHLYDLWGYEQIFKAEYMNGEWILPSNITSDFISVPDTYNYYAKNAIDNNGNMIIAWEGTDYYGNYHTYMSEKRDGVWNHPDDPFDHISPFYGGRSTYEVDAAASDNGDAIVTWYGYNADYQYYSTFISHYR